MAESAFVWLWLNFRGKGKGKDGAAPAGDPDEDAAVRKAAAEAGLSPEMERELEKAMKEAKKGRRSGVVTYSTVTTSVSRADGLPMEQTTVVTPDGKSKTTVTVKHGATVVTDMGDVPPEMAEAVLGMLVQMAEEPELTRRKNAAIQMGQLSRALKGPIPRAQAAACLQVLAADSMPEVREAAAEALAKYAVPSLGQVQPAGLKTAEVARDDPARGAP